MKSWKRTKWNQILYKKISVVNRMYDILHDMLVLISWQHHERYTVIFLLSTNALHPPTSDERNQRTMTSRRRQSRDAAPHSRISAGVHLWHFLKHLTPDFLSAPSGWSCCALFTSIIQFSSSTSLLTARKHQINIEAQLYPTAHEIPCMYRQIMTTYRQLKPITV